jgi:hypothetical protein
MNKALVLILAATVLAFGPSTAQEPESVPLYFAVSIPDANVPTIDGDNSDWAWVDKTFEVTIDDMNIIEGGVDDADDLFIDILTGWNESTNKIYVMAHVHDDELIADKNPAEPWRDDGYESFLDPDNQGGGPYADKESSLQSVWQFAMYYVETYPRLWFFSGAALQTFGQSENDFWWTHSGEGLTIQDLNIGQEYYWEWSAALFDPLSVNAGPDESTRWVLAPEQVIGLHHSYVDADPGINTSGNNGEEDDCEGNCPNGFFWQAYVSTSEEFTDRCCISDYFLAPAGETAVEASTWGQIKSLARNSL